MKEIKLTALDASQLPKYTYDEELQANRVHIVGSDSIQVNIDTKPLEDAISKGFANKPVEDVKTQIEYKEIKIPEIVKEVHIVEVPKIITETSIKTIEVPIIIKEQEIKIIEIEKPVYITKTEYVEKPVVIIQEKIKNLNYILLIQTIATIGLVIRLFIKG